MSADIEELIGRLEKATGPDKDLDTAIACAIGWCRGEWEEHESCGSFQEWISPEGHQQGFTGSACHSPNNLYYTGSIDAALTLVPGRLNWSLNNRSEARVGGPAAGFMIKGGTHFVPAIALCIASLKALSATNTGK